ncbi:hypothetical protein AB0H71_02745 [Nocardia sp. NPDC050697]|uniref:hypothetical protein n=1 Tax=Nocardia sp. NPDC050697 TaxID=3155158 RepID=UPI0033C36AB9
MLVVNATLGAPTRMVPRRILLERLLDGFPQDRIRCAAPAVETAPAMVASEVAAEPRRLG